MWWYLLLILPALIILLLLLPIYVTVRIKDGDSEVKVRLVFADITNAVIKDDEKKANKPSAKQKNKNKKRTLSDRFYQLKDELSFARELFRVAEKRLTVTRFRVRCRVSTGDAAQTAILYGTACAAAAALVAFVNDHFRVRRQNVYVYPDFTEQKSDFEAYVRLRFFVFSAVGAMIRIFFNSAKSDPDRARA